jgi:formamidopyrimidine-DNA glycosylase
MPELPEVETIVRELRPALAGRSIREVEVFRGDALGSVDAVEFAAALRGRSFGRVSRRGKYLIFRLEPALYLIGHLRMTGKFILSPPLPAPQAHHRVWFWLDDGSLMIFQDMRCFGTLDLADRLPDVPSLARLGMEPLSRRFTPGWLAEALGRSRAPLKNWLMDQSKVAGLGNIYAAEILHRAGLSPLRPACRVGPREAEGLHRAVRGVLRQAIRKNGTTISDYRRVDDKTGEFQNLLRVYGRERAPCPRCRTPIARIRQQQRSTFYCPSCQV